jgi:hypothetical protein
MDKGLLTCPTGKQCSIKLRPWDEFDITIKLLDSPHPPLLSVAM